MRSALGRRMGPRLRGGDEIVVLPGTDDINGPSSLPRGDDSNLLAADF
ncbi:hypothetical protein LY04_00979 [Oceanimonas baumannii]|uniref:Uncharacterized protein n=1 Tax=Oceanimonas baumannii TaxID=129578 RepID=A0ABY2F1Y5_9GAMM|nr:hypothetical protein LY04_00979 [Oceanimonas baumannii]